MKYIDIRVIGNSEAELQNFLVLCRYIQDIGTVGTNKTIKVQVDGGGSGKMLFNVLEVLEEDGQETNVGNRAFKKETLDDFLKTELEVNIGE